MPASTPATFFFKGMAIEPDDTAETLAPRLAAMGADLMVETLQGLEDKTIQPRPQDHSQATLAPILKKEDGLVDFTRPARRSQIACAAFSPGPAPIPIPRQESANSESDCVPDSFRSELSR